MRNFWMDHLLERVIKKVYIRNGYDFYQPSIFDGWYFFALKTRFLILNRE